MGSYRKHKTFQKSNHFYQVEAPMWAGSNEIHRTIYKRTAMRHARRIAAKYGYSYWWRVERTPSGRREKFYLHRNPQIEWQTVWEFEQRAYEAESQLSTQ